MQTNSERRSNPDGTMNICKECGDPCGGHDYDCSRFVLWTSSVPAEDAAPAPVTERDMESRGQLTLEVQREAGVA